MTVGHKDRAQAFGPHPLMYDRVRPGYSKEMAAWLIGNTPHMRVVEFGAGTGKMTQALLAADVVQVSAIEPSAKFAKFLRDNSPKSRVAVYEEHVEALDFGRDFTRSVVSAQAWHWFDEESAVEAAANIIAPLGVLGIVWNVRDASVPWVRAYTEALHIGDTLPDSHRVPTLDSRFTEVEHVAVRWSHKIPRYYLHDLAETRSHTITADTRTRNAIREAVDRVVHTEPYLRDRPYIELPYVAHLYRARRNP